MKIFILFLIVLKSLYRLNLNTEVSWIPDNQYFWNYCTNFGFKGI